MASLVRDLRRSRPYLVVSPGEPWPRDLGPGTAGLAVRRPAAVATRALVGAAAHAPDPTANDWLRREAAAAFGRKRHRR